MSEPSKVCLVALNGYAAVGGRARTTHIGGAERQIALLARELARRGYDISLVTLDHGQPDGEVIGGVRVFKAYAREKGIPGLRFFSPRLVGLWSALRRADAEVYYQRMAEQTTGLVAAFCRRHGRRFIFATASDYDCLPDLPRLRKRREVWLYRYGLRRADRVLVQTRRQRALLRSAFGVESEVLPSAGEDLAARAAQESGAGETSRVVWVGRFTPLKRLEWVFPIADACPNLRFDIVGDAAGRTAYAADLKAQAARRSNVRLMGPVEYDDMVAVYRRASVLLCTSEREGFPNTFLEAWSLGVPVVTTFDPDGVVEEFGLGRVVKDVAGVVEALQALGPLPEWRAEMSRRCRAYFEREHRVERVVNRFEAFLKDLGDKA